VAGVVYAQIIFTPNKAKPILQATVCLPSRVVIQSEGATFGGIEKWLI
jgi:hypothetical protein